MLRIKSINIDDELKNFNYIGKSKSILSEIAKFNIFVGSNNSGKSRFLRTIFSNNNLKFNKSTEELALCNNFIRELNRKIVEAFDGTPLTKLGDIELKEETFEEIKYLEENHNNEELLLLLLKKLKSVKITDSVRGNSSSIRNTDIQQVCERLNLLAEKFEKEFYDNKLVLYLEKIAFTKIYIPTLRGLRKLYENEDVFEKRTITDYFKDKGVEVFTGQNLYKDVLALLCGDFKDRNNLREFEIFLGNCFFEGKELSLIPKIDSDVLYVKIGKEKEQPIYNLGDGIQSVIILTFKLFSNKNKNVLFFIEEPELYLHPGLQRKIIETFLRDEFSDFQYFVTTHSNHLLDLTLDLENISVYKFYKQVAYKNEELEAEATFSIENVNSNDISVLNLLGVNNSSLFLSNCTIWVEGITDRLYMRKYLEIYQKEKNKEDKENKIYSEDIHYSFLEYSGGNITHWDFLDETEGQLEPMKHTAICNRIFLIADSDGYKTSNSGAKSERLDKLEEYFKERFHCLKVKEIENILIPKVLKSTIYKFKDSRLTKNPAKDQDGELFDSAIFTIDDYKEVNIGKFIDDTIDKQIASKKATDNCYDYKRRRNYAKDNTINNKVEFCKYAIDEIKTIDDISKEAIELCGKIYSFIKENNSN